jgi:hypothetical protein
MEESLAKPPPPRLLAQEGVRLWFSVRHALTYSLCVPFPPHTARASPSILQASAQTALGRSAVGRTSGTAGQRSVTLSRHPLCLRAYVTTQRHCSPARAAAHKRTRQSSLHIIACNMQPTEAIDRRCAGLGVPAPSPCLRHS